MISILRDIRVEEMQVVADDMASFRDEFIIAQCESRNHAEHHGVLWQCDECLRVFCWAEGTDNDLPGLCEDCWARFH